MWTRDSFVDKIALNESVIRSDRRWQAKRGRERQDVYIVDNDEWKKNLWTYCQRLSLTQLSFNFPSVTVITPDWMSLARLSLIFSRLFISQTIFHTNRRLFTQQLISSLNIFMCERLFVDSVYIISVIIALVWASFIWIDPHRRLSLHVSHLSAREKSTWTNYDELMLIVVLEKKTIFIYSFRVKDASNSSRVVLPFLP